jgi:hypothetical protein
MNANEAVKELLNGKKLQAIYDSDDVFYQSYSNGRVARLHSQSYCSYRLVNVWEEIDFIKDHLNIEFSLYESKETLQAV